MVSAAVQLWQRARKSKAGRMFDYWRSLIEAKREEQYAIKVSTLQVASN
jgi:hypothetical protein